PATRARGSRIPSEGSEEILNAKQHNSRADSPPEEQRNRVRDAQAQQREPLPFLQGSSSSMSSIDRFSAATKASGCARAFSVSWNSETSTPALSTMINR